MRLRSRGLRMSWRTRRARISGVHAGAARAGPHCAEDGTAEGLHELRRKLRGVSDRYGEIQAGGAACGGKGGMGQEEEWERVWDGDCGAPELFEVCGGRGAGADEWSGERADHARGLGAGCGDGGE